MGTGRSGIGGKSSGGGGGGSLKLSTIKRIEDYTDGKAVLFTADEVEEIKAKMTETASEMYRVEDMEWMGEGLETGDTFEFDKPLKSFTRDWDGVQTVVAEGDDAGLYGDTIALFQTVNKVQHLDVSKYSPNHAEEKESLLSGKFRVVDQVDGPKIHGYNTWIFYIEQLSK